MDKEYNNKRYKLIIAFIFLCLFCFLIYNLRFNKKEEKVVKNESKINLLTDYSRFFTVNSCVYKYITYLQTNNVDSILKVLDTKYKESLNINENNVFEYVENLNGNYSFVTKKIYYEQIDDYNFRYYIYGYLIEDLIDGSGKKSDRYYIVLFDTNKNIFSIKPYNEIDFKEVTNE